LLVCWNAEGVHGKRKVGNHCYIRTIAHAQTNQAGLLQVVWIALVHVNTYILNALLAAESNKLM